MTKCLCGITVTLVLGNKMEERHLKIKQIVEKELSCSAHDMDHVMRVYSLCLHLAEGEPDVDLDILKTAALLHDIARVKEDNDPTGKTDHAVLGAEMAGEILKKLGYPESKIKHVKDCIMAHRLRSKKRPKTKEAKILSDADKLDILGAIGVARTFALAGRFNQRLYTDIDIEKHIQENLDGNRDGRIRDRSKHSPFIEFETKIKFIPERLYTERAKKIARERLAFFKLFLERLRKEILLS